MLYWQIMVGAIHKLPLPLFVWVVVHFSGQNYFVFEYYEITHRYVDLLGCLRLKSRLVLRSPPTRTEILLVRVGGLCTLRSDVRTPLYPDGLAHQDSGF